MAEALKVLNPTAKQWDAIDTIMENHITCLTGAVRSGKTWSILFATPLLIHEHRNQNILISAKTLANIERNILGPLRQIYGAKYVGQVKNKKEVTLFGKVCWLVAFNDNSAAGRLQGMSLGLAIVDELTLAPESFHLMLLTRLDQENYQAVYSMNPSSPTHFAKKFIDDKSAGNKAVIHWTIDDNPRLPPSVVENLKLSFKNNPTFYKRFILGEWVNTDGLACFAFDSAVHYVPIQDIDTAAWVRNAQTLIFAVDPANANDMTAGVPVLFDKDGNSLVLRQFAHNPKTSRALSNAEQIGHIRKHLNWLFSTDTIPIKNNPYIDKIMLVDCAATDMYLQLCYEYEPQGWLVVKMTQKSIRRTLDIMNNLFAKNQCHIVDYGQGIYDYELQRQTDTYPLVEELQSVKIREKKNAVLETLELDPEDPNDSFDALRYAIAYYYRVEDMVTEPQT